MVEDVDVAAELLELGVPGFLDWSRFGAWSFDFDEGVPLLGHDDESVGYSCESWAGEFEGDSAGLFDCFS